MPLDEIKFAQVVSCSQALRWRLQICHLKDHENKKPISPTPLRVALMFSQAHMKSYALTLLLFIKVRDQWIPGNWLFFWS